jgi:hypothetical protein
MAAPHRRPERPTVRGSGFQGRFSYRGIVKSWRFIWGRERQIERVGERDGISPHPSSRRTELVSRTRCSVLNAAPQSRDPSYVGCMDPGSAAHHAANHSASKTRVNALMALRSVRGTKPPPQFDSHPSPAIHCPPSGKNPQAKNMEDAMTPIQNRGLSNNALATMMASSMSATASTTASRCSRRTAPS